MGCQATALDATPIQGAGDSRTQAILILARAAGTREARTPLPAYHGLAISFFPAALGPRRFQVIRTALILEAEPYATRAWARFDAAGFGLSTARTRTGNLVLLERWHLAAIVTPKRAVHPT